MRKKVWMITSDFYPNIGGSEKLIKEISKLLIKKGWNVEIITRLHFPAKSSYKEMKRKYEIIDSVAVNRIFSKDFVKKGAIAFLLNSLIFLYKKSVFANGKNIFHAHGVDVPAFISIIAAKLFNGKSIVKFRSGKSMYDVNLSKMKIKLILNLSDKIIVPNTEMYVFLRNNSKRNFRKIIYLPNTINVRDFVPLNPLEKRKLRQRMSIGDQVNIFLFVGRLEKVKGIEVLINAWVSLPKHLLNNSLLLIVGDGSLKDKVKSVASSEKSIRFVGFTKNVDFYYKLADVFILPSITEGFSNALAEAMASGLPVIVSKRGGNVDFIKEPQQGLFFYPYTSEALKIAILKIICMKNEWDSMGKLNRKIAEKYLNIDNYIDKLENIYLKLIDKK